MARGAPGLQTKNGLAARRINFDVVVRFSLEG